MPHFKASDRNTKFICAFLCGLLICLCAAPEIAAQRRRLYPVDESARDPSFRVFRNRLLQAARERDAQFISSILDPEIRNNFGGNNGVEEFRNFWNIGRRDSRFWRELIAVLELGGTFEGSGINRYFAAPYVFTRFPENLDAFEYGAIIGRNVRARARPETTAPVVATLTYDIVRISNENSPREASEDEPTWVRIIAPTGRRAFVQSRHIRSPVDYRALFMRRNGRWVMTAFIAGD